MNELIIRPFCREDCGMLASIHDAARREELHYAGLDAAFLPFCIAAERENFFQYTIVVAVIGGTPVAFAAYSEEELAWLYVHPSCKRQGIGRALVEYVRKEKGRMTAEVLVGNVPARRLYEACGFCVTGTAEGRMPGNESFYVRVWEMSWNKNII